MRASIAQQESGLKLSRQKLGYGKIYAPISGRIQKVLISKGEQVAPGKPVVEIVGGLNYKAVITIPERDMSNIAIGNTAYITTPDGGTWTGKIDKIYPALDVRTHTGTVDVRLDSDISKSFFAGSMTNVSLVSARYDNVLAVPTQAIFNRNGTSGVFTISGETAHWTPVTLGTSNGLQTIIKSGLSAGDAVITTPYPALNEGVKVRLSKGGAL
ncbi:MAG: efflux RND transporter periplasmic adaptor subunit [Robiginitomaculum sp.]|nr:efflux RND transporter periplasmic adaptor subunit [Robiginitomaculum sp.]